MSEAKRSLRSEFSPSVVLVLLLGVIGLAVIGYGIFHTIDSFDGAFGAPGFPDPANPRVLGQADPDWRVRGLDGTTYRFADFNDRVVFVNLWATWCGPCIQEMPSIARLYESLGEDRVAFLIVSDEDEGTVRKFVERRQYPFPVYVQHSRPPRVFHSRGIPATFVVDRQGRVVFRHLGPADWSTRETQDFLLGLAAGS
jgi:thiol-disulfide isomerase/thioredoxin